MGRAAELQEEYIKNLQIKNEPKPKYVKGNGGVILINWRQNNKIFPKRIWPWIITKHVLKVCQQMQHEENTYKHIVEEPETLTNEIVNKLDKL